MVATRRTAAAGSARALFRAFATDFTAGFGIVGPILGVWNVKLGLEQWHDGVVARSHPAVPSTVVSAASVGEGRSVGVAKDIVIAFVPSPGMPSCQATLRTQMAASIDDRPGQTLMVVPRSVRCGTPVVPALLTDPVPTLLLAAAFVAGGLWSLRVWSRLMARAAHNRPQPHPAWPDSGVVLGKP